MRRSLRIVSTLVAVFATLAALAVAFVWFGSERALAVPAAPSGFDAEGGSVDRGAHLAVVLGCEECHGADLGGVLVRNDPSTLVVSAPNLTRGTGGIGNAYADADFERALRRGVRPGGGAFLVMPSASYAALSDDDVRDVIAYVRSVPPVDRTMPRRAIGPVLRSMLALGQAQPESTALDSGLPPLRSDPVGVTVDRGHYLAVVAGCTFCHGADLGGSRAGDPNAPAPDLTAAAADWTPDQFGATLREGQDPSGHFLAASMPWKSIGQMTDDELNALDLYLKSLPRAHP